MSSLEGILNNAISTMPNELPDEFRKLLMQFIQELRHEGLSRISHGLVSEEDAAKEASASIREIIMIMNEPSDV